MSIDNFSAINADFGMSYGDFILKRTSECILKSIKPTQRLFKSGSDEFIVVDFNGSSINEAIGIYKQCKNILITSLKVTDIILYILYSRYY